MVSCMIDWTRLHVLYAWCDRGVSDIVVFKENCEMRVVRDDGVHTFQQR